MKNRQVKNINCPYCTSKKIRLHIKTKDYNFKTSNKIFTYYKCSICELIFLHPIPQDLSKYYGKDFFSSSKGESQKSSIVNVLEKFAYTKLNDVKLKTLKKLIERKNKNKNKRWTKTKKLLDVGCSMGGFVESATKYFDSHGLELSKYAVKRAIQTGLKVKQGTLKEKTFPKNSFDVVTYNHVLEHVPSLRDELGIIKKTLKKEGLLMIDVPNTKSLQAKLFGEFWFHYDAPRHVLMYDCKMQFLSGDHFGPWAASLRNMLYSNFKVERKKEKVSQRVSDNHFSHVLYLVINIMFRPINSILCWFSISDSFTIYARKK